MDCSTVATVPEFCVPARITGLPGFRPYARAYSNFCLSARRVGKGETQARPLTGSPPEPLDGGLGGTIRMKTARLCVMVLATVSLGGCGASLPSLSTGSLFGGTSKLRTPVIQNDPTSRAIEVGATSARAIKCGYNFDPANSKISSSRPRQRPIQPTPPSSRRSTI